MSSTISSQIHAFLLENKGKKIEADYMYEKFFGHIQESQEKRKQENIKNCKSMIGKTISKKGKDFEIVDFLEAHKKYGNRFRFLCRTCKKNTFDTYVQNLPRSQGYCEDCMNELKEKNLKKLHQNNKKVKFAGLSADPKNIPEKIRESWKKYSDSEYQRKLDELNDRLKKN